MKKEIIKAALATVLCLGLFGAAFAGINNIAFAAATEGTQPIQLSPPAVSIPVGHVELSSFKFVQDAS